MAETPHASRIILAVLDRLRAIDPAEDDAYNFAYDVVSERPEEWEPNDFEAGNGQTQVFLQMGKTTISEETGAEHVHHDLEIIIFACRGEDPARAIGPSELRGDVCRRMQYDILRAVMIDWKLEEGDSGNNLINDNFEPVEMRGGVYGGLCVASVYFIARFSTRATGASEVPEIEEE